jgi:mRNA-degrading endonuclease toxin of MazEF toxin-antitoxin module
LVSRQTYHPARGDIIHVNFAPSAGAEFTGPHFGLVISSRAFSRATGLCIVLPLTTKYHHDQRLHDTQLMVQLPEGTGLRQPGWVYTHQIKTIDYRERGATLAGKVAEDSLDFLIDVMERVRTFIDPDSAA